MLGSAILLICLELRQYRVASVELCYLFFIVFNSQKVVARFWSPRGMLLAILRIYLGICSVTCLSLSFYIGKPFMGMIWVCALNNLPLEQGRHNCCHLFDDLQLDGHCSIFPTLLECIFPSCTYTSFTNKKGK